MKRLNFQRANNLSLLHDELIEGVPGFHRTFTNSHGENTASPDCGRVSGLGDTIRIDFADDIPDSLVESIVQAHDSIKSRADPRRARLARIAEISAIARSDWTSAQTRELIQLLAQELTT